MVQEVQQICSKVSFSQEVSWSSLIPEWTKLQIIGLFWLERATNGSSSPSAA